MRSRSPLVLQLLISEIFLSCSLPAGHLSRILLSQISAAYRPINFLRFWPHLDVHCLLNVSPTLAGGKLSTMKEYRVRCNSLFFLEGEPKCLSISNVDLSPAASF
jgi:hypothetical protein